MQSSVESNPPPRLGDLPRTFSNDSVHISKEVSVTSSRAPTPQPQRSFYSPLPPAHVQRPQSMSSSVPFSASSVQVARWNSLSKSSEKSSIYQRAGMGRRRSSVDHDLLESNRESMKALSDFLRTREPPPTNWVSNQSSDDEKSLSAFRRSAYKLLGKSKKKKAKTPKLMQLPDSAVAAKTSRGARHIAISIPLVHDHMYPTRPDTPMPLRPKKEVQRERTDRAAVHVLKPVHEVRESVSSYLTSPTSSPTSRNGPLVVVDKAKEPDINPLAINPPDEALRQSPTLGGNKSTHLSYRPRARIEPSNAPKHDPKRTQKSYVAVSPTAMQRQDSQRSDPRHSGGTMYSTISIATPQAGHSRYPSSVSTAPSATTTHATVITALKLDLPPRNSSISKVPKLIQAELASTSARIEKQEKEKFSLPSPPNSPIKFGNESMTSAGSSNSPPLIVVGTASAARKYSGAGLDGPMLVRSNTPRSQHQTSPPPNKSLPDLPIGAIANKGLSRPRTAPPFQVVEKEPNTKRTTLTRERDAGTRSSRQERVKERKHRDIEALRSSRSPLAESNTNMNRDSTIHAVPTTTATGTGGRRITTPPRNPKRSGLSSAEKRRMANSITPIMLVASLPPHPTSPFLPLTSHHQYKKQSSSSTIRALPPSRIRTSGLEGEKDRDEREGRREKEEQQTPPHSPLTPLPSDFPNIPTHHSARHSLPAPNLLPLSHHHSSLPTSRESSLSRRSQEEHSSPTSRGRRQSLRNSILSTRRQERRAKRNLSLREQELDARLEKIERDNAVLLQTLGGIARSFGVLRRSRAGESGRGRGEGGLMDGEGGNGRREGFEEREKVRWGELRGMEPFMWELQGAAPRVSGESMSERFVEGGFEGV